MPDADAHAEKKIKEIKEEESNILMKMYHKLVNICTVK